MEKTEKRLTDVVCVRCKKKIEELTLMISVDGEVTWYHGNYDCLKKGGE